MFSYLNDYNFIQDLLTVSVSIIATYYSLVFFKDEAHKENLHYGIILLDFILLIIKIMLFVLMGCISITNIITVILNR